MTFGQFVRSQLRDAFLGESKGIALAARALIWGYFLLLMIASIPELPATIAGLYQ